jgi:hypothetical protein
LVAFDEALDVVAAVLMWRLLGFHPLLLPTFVVEFLPVADCCRRGPVASRLSSHCASGSSGPFQRVHTGTVIDV